MAEAKEVSETNQELSLVCPSDFIYCDPGDDAVLLCHLEPAISAASMEIKWRNRADLVCHYKDGEVIESCEGRVSLSMEDLHNGNVSLTLRDVRRSQRGFYICEVIHERQSMKEYIFFHIRSEDFSLVVPTGTVSADPGEDVILPAHLLPETSAVSMEIRWFRRRELIYQYMNVQGLTNNVYENRVSLCIQELRRGNLSLTLQNVDQSDSGDYTCIVFHDRCPKIGVVHLQVRELQKKKSDNKLEQLLDDLRKMQEEFLRQKIKIPEETLKLLQETLDNDGKDKKRKKRSSVDSTTETTTRRSNSTEGIRPLMGEDSTTETTTRRSNSTEGIRPLMGEDSTTETTTRRSNSTEGIRPLMGEDSTTETTTRRSNSTEGIRPLMERESSVQNTRQTREENTVTEQELSSPDTSSHVLQREGTSANTVMRIVQERTQESTAIEQVRSSPTVQSQVQEREGTSQSATGSRAQTPRRPEDRAQRRHEQKREDCQIL